MIGERTFAVWLGQNRDRSAAGFVVEDGFFCALELEENEAENQLRLTTEKVREAVQNQVFENKEDFQNALEALVKKYQISSLSAGYLHGNELFTYVVAAEVLLLREQRFYQASQEKRTLVGRFQNLDHYLFLTQQVSVSFHQQELNKFSKHHQPKEMVAHLKTVLGENQQGAVLIVQTTTVETDVITPSPIKPTINWSPVKLFQNKYLRFGALAIVLLLVLIQLATGISRSLKKRQELQFNQRLTSLTQEYQTVKQNLEQNPSTAVKDLQNLQTEVTELEKQYGRFTARIDPLASKLNQLEKLYGNAEVTPEKLFYDLALIDKQAVASGLAVTQNYLAIFDNINKKAYLINIDSKNHQVVGYPKIKQAELVAEYNNTLFLFDQESGIYQQTDDQFKKIINKDKAWGEITDLKIFNSNIYLLDRGKDEVYKYTPIEDGYGSKLSYFQSGQSLDLSTAKSLTIDFSVYILGDRLWKYTAGAADQFTVSSQLDYDGITQVYKTSDNNYLYLLDQRNARVIALNENGRLEKSIFNPLLKQAHGFGVYKDEIIIFLHQNKLYRLDNF